MTKPGTLHHIEIYVADLDRSRRFWNWLLVEELGYELYQEWNGGVRFRLEHTYLVFVQVASRHGDQTFHRCKPGLNHLAFHVGSAEDVDRLTDKIRHRGLRILYEDRHPFAGGENHYAVFFEDPDRLKVELVADK